MQDVPKNMRRTGMLLFRSGFMEALQGQTPMCVVYVAHAAEILLKARIAQEHPLLIFSKLPKRNVNQNNLTLIDLLENGRTFSYEELPDQLWAVTGIKIDRVDSYRQFGRLRNQIIHFSIANVANLDILTLQYSFNILDPLVESFWGKSVIDFIKNDFNYADLFFTGMFEDWIIKKGFSIDQRLRRVLGETSKKAWAELDKQDKEFNKDIKVDYESYLKMYGDAPDDEIYEEIKKMHTDWNAFLDSF